MRLAFLILLLIPSLAFAEPITTAIATWYALASAVEVFAVASTIISTAYSIYGAAQQRRAAKQAEQQARDEFNAKLRDKMATRVSTNAPFRYVIGRDKVGSDVVAMFSGGDKDQYKYLVCVHAAHESDAIEEIFVAGKTLGALDANGGSLSNFYASDSKTSIEAFAAANTITLEFVPASPVIVSYQINSPDPFQPFGFSESFTSPAGVQTIDIVALTGRTDLISVGATIDASYQYEVKTPRVWARKHLGTPTDPVDSWLQSEIGADKWPASALLRGFTYTIIKLDLNQPEFQGGLPPVEVLLRGMKLYDYRTGTFGWSQNNALAVFWYLTSEICGVDPSELPLAPFIAAANDCDAVQSFGPLYTFNGTIFSDEDQSKVLEKMAQSMAGRIIPLTWDIYAGVYSAPVMTLNQTDIVGGFSIAPGATENDIYSGVKGQYTSAETGYIATDFTPYQNAIYLAEDGAELFQNIDFPYTNSVQRIHNLSRIFVEDHRNGFTFSADFSLKAAGLKVGQRVYLNAPLFGQSAKVYRVMDKKHSPTSAINLTLKEDAAEIWDLANAVLTDATPNSNLPNPFEVAALANLACISGTETLLKLQDKSIVSRILVSWDASTSQYVSANGVIEIQWRRYDSAIWEKTTAPGDATQAYLSPVEDEQYYFVRARAVNVSLNAPGNWTVATIQVKGKSEPPSDVPWAALDGNRLSWGTVPDIDVAGYAWRFHYGDNASWGDAHPLHDGVITQSPWTPDNTPQGPLTLMVKAVDTSGNESGSTAVIKTQLQDVVIANIVQTVDFKASSYPGTETGATLTGGNLLADSVADFYGASGSNFYGPYSTTQFYNDYFGSMVYESDQFVPDSTGIGSKMTLSVAMTGDAQSIEYRAFGDGVFYDTIDAEDFYLADTENFFEPDPVYQAWPGQITAKGLYYQLRFSIGQGTTQGQLSTCKAIFDVPDVIERLNSISISASGTRLPITKTYAAIRNVQLTLESDGGTAIKTEIGDRDAALGPLIYCKNSSGVAVTGKVDAFIQGY